MSSQFDDRLNDWFEEVAPMELPSSILPGAISGALRVRQQRAPWYRLAASIDSAWTARTSLSPALALAAVAALLAVALAGAAVASGLVPRRPTTSVDGLIAVQEQYGAVPEGQLPDYRIRFIDPQTGQDVSTTPATELVCGAHVSPDGSQYAFLREVAHVTGAGDIWVAVAPVASDFEPKLLLHKPRQQGFDPSWAPDSSALVMTIEPEDENARYRQLWVVPVNGSPAHLVTDIPATYVADWSSSGDWIAFVGDGPEHPLYIIRPDGSDLQRPGPVGVGFVAWSPRGDELAYTTLDRKLHVISVGGQETLVTGADPVASANRFSYGLTPVWSPDATRIAVALEDGTIDVFDAHTGAVVKVTAPGPVSRPAWSANRSRLIAVADDGKLWELSLDDQPQRLIAEGAQSWCMSASYALSWQHLPQ